MTARSQAKTRRPRFNSLRWQVSTLLLLSTLTAVALTTLTIMMATALRSWPTLSMMNDVGTINGDMDVLQTQLVGLEKVPTAQEIKGVTVKLELIDERVKAMGDPAADCRPEFMTYRKEAGAWLQRVKGITEAERALSVRPLVDAHRRVQAALIASVFGTRPVWLNWLLPTLPVGLAWILVMSALSMIRAYRMQGQLSRPLHELSQAAERVKAGDYHQKIPEVAGVSEVELLSISVEAMRSQMVTSMAQTDARNTELSTILDNMNDGVLLVGARGRIMEHNPEVQNLWKVAGAQGVSPADGLLLREVFPQFSDDILSHGEAVTHEVVMDPESEPPRIFEVSINPIANPPEIPGESVPGHVLVITDVTAAREVDKLKLHFLSMVTHELKTPLTSVLGYTKVMIMGKGGELSDKQRGYVGIIDAQASRLLCMIQDLLDMTRLEVGNLTIEVAPLRVSDLLTTIYTSHLAAAKINDLNFGLVPGEIDDEEILGDPMRLAQVLGNLIGNAFKFTPRGGKVTLSMRRQGGQILLELQDTGRGIPQAAIPQLFEKFYQVERGDTRKAGGAGLGLFICRELVAQMAGRIEVTSKAGEGSRFTVFLPLYEPEKSEQGT